MRKPSPWRPAIGVALAGATLACSVCAAAPVWAAPAPARAGKAASAAARVTDVVGSRVFVQGEAVAGFVPRMPVWILEVRPDAGDAEQPGLLLAEGVVTSVSGDRATVEVDAKDVAAVRRGGLVEPRYLAEARLYRAGLPQPGATAESAPAAPATPPVTAVHARPDGVQWGKSLWLELVVRGPADKAFALYRLGNAGPYTELALEARGDGLFAGQIPVGETAPGLRALQYYLVAQGPGGRTVVAGNPADPLEVPILSAPEPAHETLVAHGPVDRASHRKPLELTAEINKRFSRPVVFYRARGGGSYSPLPMTQVKPELYRAVIPARAVVAPGVAYYIAVMDEKGIVRDGFGSSRSPQTVTVLQPQILTQEENRNRLSLRYAWADFGTARDRYHEAEAGLERLFFGFLVARLNGAVLTGQTPRTEEVDPAAVVQPADLNQLRLYRGRAGLDVHMGDYVSLSTDVVMAIFRGGGGGGLGFRAGARVGDEQVASIELVLERVWDLQTDERRVDVLRVALSTPLGDDVRLVGSAVQEAVLQPTTDDSGLRLQLGVEWDVGEHLQVEATGGMAGRQDAVGLTAAGGMELRF